MSGKLMTRRSFVKGAAAAATVTILPRHVLSGPNDKLGMACVGCGGKGESDIGGVASQNIVALCDVDFRKGQKSFRRFPQAKVYRDFRYMLHEMGDKIDAVTVSTPDHMHFPVAMMAMQMGKHAFVQKPMAHTVWEARELARVAKEKGLATQMGNQGHAHDGTRLVYEWVRSGALGPVREVLFWTDRPVWPQNIPPPTDTPDVPPHLDWNAWLGTAPYRPYHSAYLPFKWRGWWDYGCGALGDIGCHVMDAAFWALDLRDPEWIEAESNAKGPDFTPNWSIVTYQFPARGDMPPCKAVWYDGRKKPPRPKHLEQGRRFGGNGGIIIGEKASILHDFYCNSVRIVPEAKMKEIGRPPKMVERVRGGHYQEWIRACKGGKPAGSNFVDHSGPLTEMVVLGNLAVRSAKRVEWDAKKMVSTNVPEANKYVRHPYRIF
ncbi:MAG: Gfo/Idh/MocA family oxidoreductase [Planctomycetota bacterium]